MPRENVAQWNFTSGEVSPYIAGRVDTKVYANGLRTCSNFLIRPQGGASRRLGSRHVKTSWTADETSLLVPFVFSDVQAYVLQFGSFEAALAVPVTANAAGLIRCATSAEHGYATGDKVKITGFEGSSAASTNGTWVITVISVTQFDLVGTTFVASGSGSVIKSQGFIHFIKNGEPLLESTTTEVESFALSSSSGLYEAGVTDAGELPGWGSISSFFSKSDNGTIVQSAGSSNRVRITTSVPHGLRTGSTVFMRNNPDTNTTNGLTKTVNRISAYAVDLVSTTFVGVGTLNAMFSHGLLAGDRFFISGAPNYTDLTEQFHIVKSITSYSAWTIANKTYINSGAVTLEEAWTIPIEVITPYNSSELAELRFAQSSDILYIMHPDHPVMKLTRLDTDGDRLDWLLSEVDFIDGPYLPINNTAPTVDTVTPANGSRFSDVYLEVSAYTHTATVTAAVAFAAAAADQNKYLEYRQGDQWRLALLTSASSSSTTGTVNILENVLLYLDEATRFKNTPKNQSAPAGSGANSAWTPVYGTRRDGGYGVVRYQKLDPNNQIKTTVAGTGAGTGALTSNFANTFGLSDVGKYVRYTNTAGAAYWAQITKVAGSGSTASHSAALTMVSNNATGNFVITSEVRTGTVKSYRAGATYALFTTLSDVGRHIRLAWGGRWVWGKITAVVSTSEVTVTFYSDMPRDPHDATSLAGSLNGDIAGALGTVGAGLTTGRTYAWRLGAWSITTGFPSTGAFHEQRLMLARTDTQPSTFWGSITGDFESMSPTELDGTVLDDSGLDFTLASGRVNAIKWMESGTSLVIGTNGGEWLARSTSVTQEPITPTNISVLQQSRNGSSSLAQPMRIGSGIVFVDRSEANVMEVKYLFSEDRLEDKDLTVVSEHILRIGGTVVQTAYQQNPHGFAWFLMSDGTLACLTYNSDQEIIAWHRHALSGTGAFIESICVVPNSTGTADDLYMLVKRTINGSTVRYIEMMEPEFYPSGSSRLGMQFVDCARVVSGFTGTVITGLTYLTAETITVLGNGVLKTITTDYTFSAGVLTLGSAYNEVVVGLAYTSTLKSLPPEGGSAHGVSQGMKKRIPEMKVRVADSLGLNFGWASALVAKDLSALNESETTLPFFSGTVPLVPNIPYREDVPWTITYGSPYPLNVLCVVSVLETNQ